MSYSKIINHYSSKGFDKLCISTNCKEYKKGKCTIKDITNEYIVLKGDEIERCRAIKEKRSNKRACDCIILKKDSSNKTILFTELKNRKNFSKIKLEETKNKFEISYNEIKNSFEKHNIPLESHDLIFYLINTKIPDEKSPTRRKFFSKNKYLKINKPSIIRLTTCGASVNDLLNNR